MVQDIRYGIRTLLKSPGFTLIAMLSLALGIGANTAIFSIIDALMLRQLPVHEAERLVLFGEGRMTGETDGVQEKLELISEPMLAAIRQEHRVFADACGMFSMGITLHPFIGGASASERLRPRLVTGNFFAVLGVTPAAGRLFSGAEDTPLDAHADIVLNYGYWQRRFGGRTDAIGSTMRIGGRLFTVIGVAAPEFVGTNIGEQTDAWIPLSMEGSVPPYFNWHGDRDQALHVLARLQPGVTITQAAAAETVLARRLTRGYLGSAPAARELGEVGRMRVELTPAATGISQLRNMYASSLRVMMVVVGIVLLIACANVANLLLARGAARQREMAVRFAVGSGRARVVRQLLTESLLLSLGGGALGVLFAMWGSHILLLLVQRGPDPVPLNVDTNLRVLAFTLVVSAATGLLFGIAPAFRASSVNLVAGLRAGGRGSTLSRGHLFSSRALVVSQIALSLLLLIGAGLFVRTFRNLENIDPGFSPNRLTLFLLDTEAGGIKEDNPKLNQFYDRVAQRVAQIPGVESVAVSKFFFGQGMWTTNINAEGHPELTGSGKLASMNVISPEYFSTVGIPLKSGRDFRVGDTVSSPKTAVINEAAARGIFGSASPIGKHMDIGDDQHLNLEIVGVAANAKYNRLTEETQWAVYIPIAQHRQYLSDLMVRTQGDPASVISPVRAAIFDVNRDVPIAMVSPAAKLIEGSLGRQHLIAELSLFFGALALLLAAIGLYGILSYSVSQRANEIGVRMALGAQSARVLWMILRETLLLVGLGVAIGIPAALLCSRLIESMLYGLKATDVGTMGGAVVVLIAVGSLAGLLPARRASQVDPMVALRYE